MNENEFSSGKPSERTCGNFATEKDACRYFNDKIMDSGLFKIHEEVEGRMIYMPPHKGDQRGVRIDRILSPEKKLRDSGWNIGFIGVEIKRSGKKVGPPLAQAMDYMDAVWFITECQYQIQISHVFLFPCEALYNNIGSVCAQHHLGQIEITSHKIQFRSGQHNILYYDFHTDRIDYTSNGNGKRVGSR